MSHHRSEREIAIKHASHEIDSPASSRVWPGALAWLAFCVLVVASRGVRWDETYEHAQVLLGRVIYPPGHPLFRYVRGGYSLQTYVSSVLLWLGMNDSWLCGFRNVLCLASSVVPVFLFGALLSGRTLWGHAAAALALRGVYLTFSGSYPVTVWPGTYSNGPIGGGCVLLALYWLLAGRTRSGYLFAGLTPALHIGQAPPLLLQYAFDALARLRREGLPSTIRMCRWMLAGLVVSAALVVVTVCLWVPERSAGAYAPQTAAHPIWKWYTACYDGHRQAPPMNGHLALAGLLWLAACATLGCDRGKAASPMDGVWRGILLYASTVAAIVWGVLLVHTVMGPDIPYLLIGWMPYRLINHVPPLLLAASVAVAARQIERPTAGLALLCVMGYACLSIEQLSSQTSSDFAQRYLAAGDVAMFFLYGMAIMELLRTAPRWMGFLSLVLLVVMACVHQAGTVFAVFGFAAAWFTRPQPHLKQKLVRGVGALALTLVYLQLSDQANTSSPARVGDFERRVVATLSEQNEPQAMLLAGPNEPLLQARTGHPVFVEATTASLMSYMPALAPTIQQMYDDLYGIRFDAPPPSVPWMTRWAEWTPEQWTERSNRWGFRYIVTPDTLTLKLPALFSEGGMTFYAIPE